MPFPANRVLQPDDHRATAKAEESDVLSLLQCPHCTGPLFWVGGRKIACGNCFVPVQVPDGIIDFVAGSAFTQLDNIDYDAFYPVNEASALQQYSDIRASIGPLWPDTLGDAVEIGAGTGGFTMAVLRQSPAKRVLITDISARMLALCRGRLSRFRDLKVQDLGYATYSTDQACFRADAFDTCYGTAVVHHITDVPHFLRQVHRLLKPGGRAFFTEPNLRFHRALTATLADLLAGWIDHGSLAEADRSHMMNWLAEVHCNIVNAGDLAVLAHREDKHMFVAEAFEAMAEDAGFGVALAVPVGQPDMTGWTTIAVYLGQAGVGPAALALLEDVWPAAQARYFERLAPRDRSSPSYLFWLEKRARKARFRTPPAGDLVPTDAELRRPPTCVSLAFTLQPAEVGLVLGVSGWCLSAERVKSVQVTVAGTRCRLPIWLPRPDVHSAMNPGRLYPPLHALCSGVDGKILLPDVAADGRPVPVTFDIVTVDERLIRGLDLALLPDGGSRTAASAQLGDPVAA